MRCLGDGIISGSVVPYKGSVITEGKEEGGRRQIVLQSWVSSFLGGAGPRFEPRVEGGVGPETADGRRGVNNDSSGLPLNKH